nr:MAG TPA: hypothetical protein [Caudoviricetes sp.]
MLPTIKSYTCLRPILWKCMVCLLEERNADNRRGRSKMSAATSEKALNRLRKRSRGGLFFVK